MDRIKVIYGRSFRPISLIIQLRTLSHWSHIGVIDGDSVIESVGGQGVVVTPIELFRRRYKQSIVGYMYCIDKAAAMTYLRSKVGMPYDTKAIIGFALALGWDDLNAMHCSELVAGATGLFNPLRLNEVSPGQLRKLTHAA